MRGHDKARAAADGFPVRPYPVAATIGELTAMALFAPPCCGHIALCDGACRDARHFDEETDVPLGGPSRREDRR